MHRSLALPRPRLGMLVGVLALLSALVPSVALAAPDGAVKVPIGTAYKEMLRIDGSVLVWQQGMGEENVSPFSTHAYDMATGVETTVTPDLEMSRWPVVSGRTVIVWGKAEGGTEAIYRFDLDSQETTLIADGPREQRSPEVSGDIVAWVDYRNSKPMYIDNGDIRGYDLELKQEFVIADGPADQTQPTVWGDWVAWTEGPYGQQDIKARNIVTGETLTVCGDAGQQYYPRIGDGIVVWQDERSGNDIRGYDLIARRPLIVANTPAHEGSPSVSDSIVAWFESTTGGGRVVKGYDRLSGSTFSIEESSSVHYFGGVSEGNAAWIEWLGGESSNVWIAPYTLISSVEGSNRYSTAAKASAAAYPDGAEAVVIATGRNWPDALGGAALAGSVDGPLLLTDPNALPASTKAEIQRLKPEGIILLGGTGVVSPAVEAELGKLVGSADVVRLNGRDRYDTAAMIGAVSAEIQEADFDGTAFVATGGNFPDALAAAPLEVAAGWPLFLAEPRGMSQKRIDLMKAVGVKNVVILGGTGVVSSTTETKLKTAFGGRVTRLAGKSRYDTAVKVAEHGVSKGYLSWDSVGLTSGVNFPDGLAGGVLQGAQGAPMLLTRPTSLSGETAAQLNKTKDSIGSARYVGGTASVGVPVRKSVRDILE